MGHPWVNEGFRGGSPYGLSYALRTIREVGHAIDCLKIRYCDLPSEAREYWPPDFTGREDMCTCDANPEAAAKQPELAETVIELRDYIKTYEAR
ncbi:hypothetical protein DDT46_13920 [Mycobacteroides abscessus]|nr:hypothetical protein DDT46_13920 [Mycobacteroides abscessus]RIS83620.1 hypothetical protein D2E44_10740 [Mycobacteroides abscessus]